MTKMKKSLIFQAPVLYALFALCILFTACSDGNTSPKDEEKPATVKVLYSFTMDQSFFNLVNASVVFWNDQGVRVTETMTKNKFDKEFTLTKSQEFGYVINIVAKPNIDELLIPMPATYVVNTTHSDGYITSANIGVFSKDNVSYTVQKAKIKDYIAGSAVYHKYSLKWNKETNTITE